jgi:hypothetical protein
MVFGACFDGWKTVRDTLTAEESRKHRQIVMEGQTDTTGLIVLSSGTKLEHNIR